MFARSFSRSLDKLDPESQAQAKQRVTEFLMDPELGGHNLEPIQAAGDRFLYSIRVNRDVRIILYRKDGRHVFLYVDHHDRAYAWASRHQMKVHPTTGAAQLIEIEEVTRQVVHTIVTEERRLAPLLGDVEDDYLLALGVPENYLPAVKHIGRSKLVELIDHLPEEAMERLLLLADGHPVPTPQVPAGTDPFDHPDAQRRFRPLATEEELQRALEYPWEQWLVFLHPTQQELVERTYSGPARVSGAAGTGKTVVALHRVAHLRRKNPDARILLTTYSKALAARLADKLELLLGSTERNTYLQISNLHRVANDLWSAWGNRFQRLNDQQLERAIASATARVPSFAFSPSFVRAEWEQIVDPLGIRSWEEYRRVPRVGRGTPLGVRQRKQLWDAFESLHEELEVRALMTFDGLCYLVAKRLEETEQIPFDHVIVDESQDLGPAELHLARALAAPGPDDLFFCGDMGQRIYRGRFSWLSRGIDVRGRSACLRVNYRTTEQIRAFADGILPNELTNPDGETESRTSVSLLSGVTPVILEHEQPDDEIQAIAITLKDLLDRGYRPGEIGIFARTRRLLEERAEPVLDLLDLAGKYLKNDALAEHDAISLGSMHIAKGLEFKAVLLIGCDIDRVPLRYALEQASDTAERDVLLELERQLLYVACTRAREVLVLTSTGSTSEFLRREFER